MIRAAGSMALAATALLAAAALTAATSIAADEPAAVNGHWAYSHDEFTVVATGRAEDSVLVVQRLHALDGAMRKLLRLPVGANSPPTSVYLLPAAELAAIDPIWSSQGGAFLRAAPFDDYLVLAAEHGAALDAELRVTRTLALLSSWGLGRLPDWYQQGIAQLAAGAEFGSGTITIGQDSDDQAGRMSQEWIPAEKFLRLPSTDPEFQGSPAQLARYRSQCWWVAHLLLIDRVLDPAISQYVERLMAGEDQKQAFLASFNTSYDQLDEYFRKVRHKVHLHAFSAEMPAVAAGPAPRALTDVGYRAELAQLALIRDNRSAPGLQLARDVLATEAENETALLALARADLAARHFAEADSALQRLHARAELSVDGRRTLADLEMQLAKQRDESLPGTQELDARKLRAAARGDFQRVLESDPDDVKALYQLSWLQAASGDVAGVRALLPAAEKAYYHRPDSAELAALLVRMNSMGGSPAEVFKYSVAEQRLATTEAQRASAAARVARLRSQLKAPQ